MRRVGGGEVQRHVLVDGNNLLHKAFYVFVESRMKSGQPMLSTSDGWPTGLVYGFLDMLGTWLREIAPFTSVSVFFDGASQRRKAMDPSYKSNRDETASRGVRMTDGAGRLEPRALPSGASVRNEVEAVVHLLPLLGCSVYHHPTEEADDLIASFCRANPESVRVIVSSDKDFFQLLEDPRVVCYVPGAHGDRFFDAERSAAYWEGLKSVRHRVTPQQVRMFKALCGDSSDAIAGVRGLRKKVAIPLCHLSTVEEVLASGLPGFSATEREKTIEAADRIRVNLELVAMRSDIDLSPYATPPATDHGLARRVMASLDISSVDPASFTGLPVQPFVDVARPPADPPQIPLDSWLTDLL